VVVVIRDESADHAKAAEVSDFVGGELEVVIVGEDVPEADSEEVGEFGEGFLIGEGGWGLLFFAVFFEEFLIGRDGFGFGRRKVFLWLPSVLIHSSDSRVAQWERYRSSSGSFSLETQCAMLWAGVSVVGHEIGGEYGETRNNTRCYLIVRSSLLKRLD